MWGCAAERGLSAAARGQSREAPGSACSHPNAQGVPLRAGQLNSSKRSTEHSQQAGMQLTAGAKLLILGTHLRVAGRGEAGAAPKGSERSACMRTTGQPRSLAAPRGPSFINPSQQACTAPCPCPSAARAGAPAAPLAACQGGTSAWRCLAPRSLPPPHQAQGRWRRAHRSQARLLLAPQPPQRAPAAAAAAWRAGVARPGRRAAAAPPAAALLLRLHCAPSWAAAAGREAAPAAPWLA